MRVCFCWLRLGGLIVTVRWNTVIKHYSFAFSVFLLCLYWFFVMDHGQLISYCFSILSWSTYFNNLESKSGWRIPSRLSRSRSFCVQSITPYLAIFFPFILRTGLLTALLFDIIWKMYAHWWKFPFKFDLKWYTYAYTCIAYHCIITHI